MHARRTRQLIVAVMGAVLALVALAIPRAARASTGNEACDPDVYASMMPLAELSAMLNLGALGETDRVGFCDSRGATSIAPLPARPLDGSVIDVADGDTPWIRDGVNVGSQKDDPSHRSVEVGPIDHAAWTGPVLFVPRRGKAVRVPVVATRLDLPDGFGRGVDHPPRR